MKSCPRCQAYCASDDRFCRSCGASLAGILDEAGLPLDETQIMDDGSGENPDPYTDRFVTPVELAEDGYQSDVFAPVPEEQLQKLQAPTIVNLKAETVSFPERGKSNKGLMLVAGALVLAVLVCVIALVALSFSNKTPSPQIDLKPSILGQDEQGVSGANKDKATPVAPSLTNPGVDDPDKEARAREDAEVNLMVKRHYDWVKQARSHDREIAQLLSEEFDKSHESSITTREQYRKNALALKEKIQKDREAFRQAAGSKDYGLYPKVDRMFETGIDRIDVLLKAYDISLKYEDASSHKSEILKPFRDAYAPGTNGSKYVKEFKELSELIEGLTLELETSYENRDVR